MNDVAADAAGRDALALARAADRELVAAVVRRLFLPWLEDGAHAFQDAVEREALPGRAGQPPVEAHEDMCLLFVDGLRYELARALAGLLEARGFSADLRHRWAALPTLTATGKPAATPVAAEIIGAELGGDFAPRFEATGRRVEAEALRAAMEERGYQVLAAGTLDAPLGSPARGWAEGGAIDKLGHELDAADFARKLRDDYAHGGLSIQECLVPDLTIQAALRREAAARVRRIVWRGFRCLVVAVAEAGGVSADLRLKNDPRRSVATAVRPLDADGSASLLLADDDHERSRLVLVLVDDEGRILDRRETAVGEDS